MGTKPNGSGTMHPALGGIDEEGTPAQAEVADVERSLPVQLPKMPAPPRRKSYCDICGMVDEHADGCDVLTHQEAQQSLAELDAEEQRPEVPAIRPMLRRIGATLLRRLAAKIEGD